MHSRGFTFIEMLLAVAIFGLVGLASASVLSSVLETDAVARKAEERLVQLQRFFSTLERDLAQISVRHIRIDGEAPIKAIWLGEKFMLESDSDAFAFVHHGWRNPGMVLPRSEIQAVGYRLRDAKIERLFSLHPDAITGSEPKVQVLLEQVSDFKVEYKQGETWESQWSSERLPKAIRLTIKHETLGDMVRFYSLLDGLTDA